MKNQYFGDTKDLFKYDLVEYLVRRVPGVDRFTFVTMLTEKDDGTDGNKLDYSGRPGSLNTDLVGYLRERVSSGRRNVSEIREYYEARGIGIEIYGEHEFFTHAARSEYFGGIDDALLAHSVIVLDPDNGFETKRSNKRHVLRSEVADLYERMTAGSILAVFQHFRREKHDLTIERVSRGLEEACRRKPLWICDNEIMFFLLDKDPEVRKALRSAARDYAQKYPGKKRSHQGVRSCLSTGSDGC